MKNDEPKILVLNPEVAQMYEIIGEEIADSRPDFNMYLTDEVLVSICIYAIFRILTLEKLDPSIEPILIDAIEFGIGGKIAGEIE